MGLFVDDLSLSVIVTHILYKTALVIAIMRWVVSWALSVRNRSTLLSSSTNDSTTITTNTLESEDLSFSCPPTSPCSCPSTQLIRDGLILTTFGDITERFPDDNSHCDTCAVCLNKFRENEEVRELRNCCHVFHRECLDRWLDHDHQNQDSHHKTCPLCRAPFLTPSQSQSLSLAAARSQPSWAVERLLYLFGDDLLL